jgi:GNAT superfamily N-acetyltransferase
MECVPLHRTWHLSIRSLIRSDFRDRHPTRFVDWTRGCMIVRRDVDVGASPRLLGVCLVDENGYLRYLVVRKEFRGQGFGTKMLRACAHDISHLTCAPALIPFYARHDFAVSQTELKHGMVEMRVC